MLPRMGRTSRQRRRQRQRTRVHVTSPGTPPGTLVPDPQAPSSRIHVTTYGPHELREFDIADPEELRPLLEGHLGVLWIDVMGLGDVAMIESIGRIFGIHRLALEDVVNTRQRSKVESYGELQFVVMRMAFLHERDLITEQISLFLGPGVVLTFQEIADDTFLPVRDRLRAARGTIRNSGADYLAYALIDAVVDHLFPVLEHYGERIETLEEQVLARPDNETVEEILSIKRDLLTLQRAVWPQQDLIRSLSRDPSPHVTETTRVYLRDCHDHVIRVLEILGADRELTSTLMEVYLSSVSQRTNEIVKVLTILSAIFIPLSFIAGVYGMNFNPETSRWNMPELGWKWGYPFSLGLMAATAATLLGFFWRRGWMQRPRRRRDAGNGTRRPPQ